MRDGSFGVLLLAMGGPPSCEAIEQYLYNLFSDPLMVQLPCGMLLQKPFAWCLSKVRTPKVAARYRRIGGFSPLGKITAAQAAALEQELAHRGIRAQVTVALRYWKPDTREAVQAIKMSGVRSLVAIPMYPQYCRATTGSSLQKLTRTVKELSGGKDLAVYPIKRWWNRSGYLGCMTRRLHKALDQTAHSDSVGVLFLAHSIPQKFVDQGDPYVEEVEKTVREIVRCANLPEQCPGDKPWFLAYQSRIGPFKWVGPSVEEVIPRMITQGRRSIVVVPVSFVSDHLETLYDIDIVLKDLAYQCGASQFIRVESLNDSPDFIAFLAELVIEEARLQKT